MLEPAVDDGPEDLWLEQEVPEAGAVDGDVGTLHGVLLRHVLKRRSHCQYIPKICTLNVVF